MADKRIPELPALHELQSSPNWVLWKFEERDGKRTKVPYSAKTGRRAESDNSATWSAYRKACAVLKQFPETYDGLGFMFDGKHITGIDLDHCVNSDQSIDPWAREILDRLNSYAEFSPSGTGIHVYVLGTISASLRRKVKNAPQPDAAIEMYCTGRYFTVTGQHVPETPVVIEERAEILEELSAEFNPPKSAKPLSIATAFNGLSNEDLLEKARTATNGEKFWALWNGDFTGYVSQSEAEQALCTMLAFWTGRDAQRIDTLFQQSALYRPDKWNRHARKQETYGEGTIQRAIELCDTVYNPHYRQEQVEKDIAHLLQRIAQCQEHDSSSPHDLSQLTPRPVATEKVLVYLNENEDGDASFFSDVFDGQVCYDHSEKKWYVWNGQTWTRDATNQTRLLVSGVLSSLYIKASADLNLEQARLDQEIATLSAQSLAGNQIEALKEKNKQVTHQRDELMTRAKALRSDKRNTSVLKFVASRMGVTSARWDTDPWLLAVRNGVIDLRTGECRNGVPTDYLRKSCPTLWTGLETPCPRFEDFLQEVFEDRPEPERNELIAFLHRLFGYSITGLATEAIFPIFCGREGQNGKSVLFKTLRTVLGSEIADVISNDVIIATDKNRTAGAATPHVCALQGKRIVWGAETKKGDKLNIAQIKNFTGNDPLSARPMYGEQYTFLPTHTLFLHTNYKPHADADDIAFWTRACLIDFVIRFVEQPQASHERKKDPRLGEKLQAETSGILAWFVRGCLAWQEKGSLAMPASIRMATDNYRQHEDHLVQFIEDCCIVSSEVSVPAKQLYNAYKTWSAENQFGKGMNSKLFGETLERKFQRKHTNTGNIYTGLQLRSTSFISSSSFDLSL